MSFSGMSRRVPPVKTEVSEERNVSMIKVTRIDELRTTLAVTSNRSTFLHNVLRLLVTANLFLARRFLSP
jgi:hypothetical protein